MDSQDHPAGFDASDLAGFQIYHHRYGLANQLLGRVGFSDAGNKFPDLVSNIHFKMQELVCFGDPCGFTNFGDSDIQSAEIVVRDGGL